jgi:hypothetical protein
LALLLSEPALKFLQQHLTELPWLTKLSGTDLSELKLEIGTAEKFLIYSGAILTSALASLIPGAIVLGRKTLSLVKKD